MHVHYSSGRRENNKFRSKQESYSSWRKLLEGRVSMKKTIKDHEQDRRE